jgi:hypothetical protein
MKVKGRATLVLLMAAVMAVSIGFTSIVNAPSAAQYWRGYRTPDMQWVESNLSPQNYYYEGDWCPYVLVITDKSAAWDDLAAGYGIDIGWTFYSSSKDAVYIDMLANFAFQWDATLRSDTGIPLADGEPGYTGFPEAGFPDQDGTWTAFTPSMLNRPTDGSVDKTTGLYKEVSETCESPQGTHFFRIEPGVGSFPGKSEFNGAHYNIVIFFQAHLSLSIVWENGLEYMLSNALPQYAGTLYTDPFNYTCAHHGSSAFQGAASHFYLQAKRIGAMTIPIPIAMYPVAKVEGHKYNDTDGNGCYTPGDTPIQGWGIDANFTLYEMGVPIKFTLPHQTTNSSGAYSYTELTEGTIEVKEETRDGWTHTGIEVNGTCYPGPEDHRVANIGKSSYTLIDFLNTQPKGTIIVYKWEDMDGDGVKEVGDNPITGWHIDLYKLDGTYVWVADGYTSDPEGTVTFSDLAPGTYKVVEEDRAGWIHTCPASGANYYDGIALSSGATVTRDFGNFELGCISGHKWEDLNGDGYWGVGEPPLSGWNITLDGYDTIDDVEVHLWALTDDAGYYEFCELTNGTYTVGERLDLKPGWVQTAPAAGTFTIDVTSGTVSEDNDFGNFELGCISGHKWEDLNGDGYWGVGEPPLSGWNITLDGYDTIDDVEVHLWALTDDAGYYEFCELTNGTYTVGERLDLKPGWVQTAPAAGTFTIDVTSGTVSEDNDFGNFELGCISGHKWEDLNGDGYWGVGEPPLSGWNITLDGYDTIDDVEVHLWALTDDAGYYEFCELTNGTYTVGERLDLKPGWVQTAPAAGTFTIDVTSGTVSEDNDFGNFELGCISGHKWEDLNGDGYWGVGEPPLSGWNITLDGYDTIDDVEVHLWALTDDAGYYEFCELTNGTYTVGERLDLKPGWVQTAPAAGTFTIDVTSGTVSEDNDFGNMMPPRVTRTQGFWATHTEITCDDVFYGILGREIDIGAKSGCYINITSCGELMGAFWSGISRKTDGSKRSLIDQARMILVQQLVAAILNHAAFGTPVPIDPVTGEDLVTAGNMAYAGTNRTEMLRVAGLLDGFNNSGDDQPLPDPWNPPGPATPQESRSLADREFWDDPCK